MKRAICTTHIPSSGSAWPVTEPAPGCASPDTTALMLRFAGAHNSAHAHVEAKQRAANDASHVLRSESQMQLLLKTAHCSHSTV